MNIIIMHKITLSINSEYCVEKSNTYHFENKLEKRIIHTKYDEILELKLYCSTSCKKDNTINNIICIINKFQNVKKIKIVAFFNNLDKLIIPLQQLKNLEYVYLNAYISDDSLVNFVDAFWDKLKGIKFYANYDENLLTKCIGKLCKSEKLEELKIIKFQINSDKLPNLFDDIINIKTLKILSLDTLSRECGNMFKNVCEIISTHKHNLSHFSLNGATINSLPKLIATNKIITSIYTDYKPINTDITELVNALKTNNTLKKLRFSNHYISSASISQIIEMLNINKTLKNVKFGVVRNNLFNSVTSLKMISCLKNNHILEEFTEDYGKYEPIDNLCIINKLINTPVNWQYIFLDEMRPNTYWSKYIGKNQKEMIWCDLSRNILLEFKKVIIQYILCLKYSKYIIPPKYIKFEIIDHMFFNYLVNTKLNPKIQKR